MGVREGTPISFYGKKWVPMIAMIYNQDSNHNFVLTVIDADKQKSVETLKFHLTPAQ